MGGMVIYHQLGDYFLIAELSLPIERHEPRSGEPEITAAAFQQ
jgi:hypothetical protein